MDTIFMEQEGSEFQDRWKTFVMRRSNASWSYLPLRQEYNRLYSGSRLLQDISFLVMHGDETVAVCPLLLERQGDVTVLGCGGGFNAAPLIDPSLSARGTRRVRHACFARIDELAAAHEAVKAMFMIDPLPGPPDYNILTEYGYLDASICTSIVDLSLDETVLRQRLRKSYKSLINNVRDRFEIDIVDASCADRDIHEQYRQLHHKTAGRVTRDVKTFDLQFDMLTAGRAILVGLRDGDRFVAFSYFYHHNGGAYYASASDDPDYQTDTPLEHGILWAAIDYYRRCGFKKLEIGWQHFGPQLFDHPSPKDRNLSFFKRGFGGRIVSLYRGVKYYDMATMRRELQENVEALLADIGWDRPGDAKKRS